MRRLGTAVAVAALSMSILGCRFAREVVNPEVRNIDTSWIVPGKTSRQEIIDKIGFPPTVKGLGGVTKDSFRWTTWDTFTTTFEAGYIVTPTIERGRENFSEDILVRFDADGIVKLLSRTRTRDGKLAVVEWKECDR